VLTTHPLSASTNRMGGHRAQGRADVKPRHGIHEYPGQCGRQFQPARHVGRHPAGLHLDDPSRDAVGNLSAERCGAVASGPFREGVGHGSGAGRAPGRAHRRLPARRRQRPRRTMPTPTDRLLSRLPTDESGKTILYAPPWPLTDLKVCCSGNGRRRPPQQCGANRERGGQGWLFESKGSGFLK
jgi:hypothetical protein